MAEVSRRLMVLLVLGQAAMYGLLWVRGVTLQSAFTATQPGQRDVELDLLAVLALAALAMFVFSPSVQSSPKGQSFDFQRSARHEVTGKGLGSPDSP